MRMRRILSPLKLLLLCVAVFSIALVYMIFDTIQECRGEELLATKKLLQKFSDQLQDLKSSQKLLKEKLQDAETQLLTVRKSITNENLPLIYLVTPTHSRLEQKAELTRLSQTFMHVKNVHWIVIEDAEAKTHLVSNLLKQCGLKYTHLNVQTPQFFKMSATDPNWLKPRGVLQRNAALEWLRATKVSSKLPAVVYFADDDNTYSLQLFEEMRFTKKVSVWPVGLVGYLRYESPVVSNGKVTGWFTYWKPQRPFAMDMAGFAINLQLIIDHPTAAFSNEIQRGYQESYFLTGLTLTLNDLEPKAKDCSEILVWHTRTEKSSTKNEEKLRKKLGHGSNVAIEV